MRTILVALFALALVGRCNRAHAFAPNENDDTEDESSFTYDSPDDPDDADALMPLVDSEDGAS